MAASVPVRSLNPHLMCALCSGYFIDPVTITECLHSFCKSCIIKYLDLNKKCPICDLHIHKTRPLLNIRSDKTLQEIVYKLVPGLHQEEMRRRQLFYEQHPVRDANYQSFKEEKEKMFFSSLDKMSLSFEYYDQDLANTHTQKVRKGTSNRRFLQCPGMMKIKHLKKFVRMKYGLVDENFAIDVIYKNELIPEEYTLIDVAYLYNWRKETPMQFYYRVFKKNIVHLRKRKRKHSTTNDVMSNNKKTTSVMEGIVVTKNGTKEVSKVSPTPISSPKKSTEVIELSINVSANDVKQVVSELNSKDSKDEPLEKKRSQLSSSDTSNHNGDESHGKNSNTLHSRTISTGGNSILSTIVQNLARKKLEDSHNASLKNNSSSIGSQSKSTSNKEARDPLSKSPLSQNHVVNGTKTSSSTTMEKPSIKTIGIKADRGGTGNGGGIHHLSKKGLGDRSLMKLGSSNGDSMGTLIMKRPVAKEFPASSIGIPTSGIQVSSNKDQTSGLSFTSKPALTTVNKTTPQSLPLTSKPAPLISKSVMGPTGLPVLQITSSAARLPTSLVTVPVKAKTTSLKFSVATKPTTHSPSISSSMLGRVLPTNPVGHVGPPVKELIWGQSPTGSVSMGLNKAKMTPISKALNQSIRQIPNPSLLTKPKSPDHVPVSKPAPSPVSSTAMGGTGTTPAAVAVTTNTNKMCVGGSRVLEAQK
ncbi:polycomb group protein Psc-like [Tigriopus californicus]|uniref:polycomb group protein Psc-like n=1 Tax=Tigriopus californicus TaxID=6832 RepID=UPI0027DA2BE2|nr:polycomb group protein Psc-like [Tigriopus californicus]